MNHVSGSEVTLTSRLQLQRWAAALPIQRRPAKVYLNLPALPEHERVDWQQRIERSHNDCGCSAAAIAFLGAIGLVVGYEVLVGFEQPIWLVALATAVTAIAALFVGKTFGHLLSRRKLQRQVTQLVHLVEQTNIDEPHT